jgi:DNA-binding XRE family transcriptional regulator
MTVDTSTYQQSVRDLGVQMRAARERLGLTREQLAKQADVPAGTVRRVEQGALWEHPGLALRLVKHVQEATPGA